MLGETGRFKAWLRVTEYRDRLSATRGYDDRPILDVLRRVGLDTVLGAMDARNGAVLLLRAAP
ncbi:DUF4334 domain-containing protein [Corallococcus sp. RDP092CA]|uniref:DUF4334 domain-containing protein n=1 Tax=Corallococcus sp. RDP092CA TaxID=3109369 RepID=UPI0035B44EBE